MPESPKYADVAVPFPFGRPLLMKSGSASGGVKPGRRVLVPSETSSSGLRGRLTSTPPAGKKILPLRRVFADEFSLPEKFLGLLDWVARYYFSPREVIKAALPAGMQLKSREVYELTLGDGKASSLSPKDPSRKKSSWRSSGAEESPLPPVWQKNPPALDRSHQGNDFGQIIAKEEDEPEQKIKEKFMTILRP